jgi:hypothetical protein
MRQKTALFSNWKDALTESGNAGTLCHDVRAQIAPAGFPTLRKEQLIDCSFVVASISSNAPEIAQP